MTPYIGPFADMTEADNIETEEQLKQALIKLLSELPLSISPPMVAAAMGEALADFLEEEMS